MWKKDLVRQFFRFGVVGGLGVAVNTGFLFLLTEFAGIDYRLSSIGAIEMAIIHNFFWNYHWTFSDRKSGSLRHVFFMFVKFNVSSGLTALTVNWGILVFLTEVLGLYYHFSNLIGIALGTLANFLASRQWAFVTPVIREPE